MKTNQLISETLDNATKKEFSYDSWRSGVLEALIASGQFSALTAEKAMRSEEVGPFSSVPSTHDLWKMGEPSLEFAESIIG